MAYSYYENSSEIKVIFNVNNMWLETNMHI